VGGGNESYGEPTDRSGLMRSVVTMTPDEVRALPWEELRVRDRADIERVRKLVASWAEQAAPPVGAALLGELRLLTDVSWPPTRSSAWRMLPSPRWLISAIDVRRALIDHAPEQGRGLLWARAVEISWFDGRRASAHQALEAAGIFAALAEPLFDPIEWSLCHDCLVRAARLAQSLGHSGSALATQVLERAERLALAQIDDPRFFSLKVAELMLEHRHRRLEAMLEQIRAIARRAQIAGEHDRARQHWAVADSIAARMGDKPGSRAARAELAKTAEQQANSALDRGDAMAAAGLQAEAVHAWRKVPEATAERAAAVVRLQHLQAASGAAMSQWAAGASVLDLSEDAARAREVVDGLGWGECVAWVCEMARLASESLARPELTSQQEPASPISAILPLSFMNRAGRTVARRPSALVDPEGYAESVRSQRTRDAQRALSCGVLLPMLDQMRIEHGVPESQIYSIALRSTFVPTSRVGSFARGLASGFDGDFSLAAHLLMPQFEQAVRRAVEQRGGVVSTLEPDGTQKEVLLDPLLQSPEAIAFFGEHEALQLRELLTDRNSVNLRNRLAHGLLDDGEATDHLAYFWWQLLRYCVIGPSPEGSGSDAASSAEPEATPSSSSGVANP